MSQRRRSQEERRQETGAKLIEATIDIINQKGYASMRTGDITKKAGVTWGAAQHLFGSRDDLIAEVSSSVAHGLANMLETDIDPQLPTYEKLSNLIDKTWNVYSSDDYVAMIEIIRGTRRDIIHDRLVEAQMQITKKIEAIWTNLFVHFDWQEAKKQNALMVCNLVTLFLSGLAARKIYLFPATEAQAYLAFIKSVAVRELERPE